MNILPAPLRESQIFPAASGSSYPASPLQPIDAATLMTLKKNFESALSSFLHISNSNHGTPFTSGVNSGTSSGRHSLSGGEGPNWISEITSSTGSLLSQQPISDDFSSVASARAVVSRMEDDPKTLKDYLAVLLHMIAEAVVSVPADEKKKPKPPTAREPQAPLLSPRDSARPRPKVSTWYRRGSTFTSSSSSALSIYRTPSVVETEQVVIGRDDDDNKTINDYVVIGQLGKGSYGKVKLAEKQSTGQLFAIKIIKMSVFGKNVRPQVWKKLQQEIQVMRRVAHENLVRLFEVMHNAETEKMYLVMQYVPKGTVSKVMPDGSCDAIDPPQLKLYAKQLVKAVYALHRANVFHRDIKPDNVLLGEEGKIYLADFGVSVICSEDGVEGVEGTPAYMAPELCRAEKNVRGDLVDVWALGVTLYQLMYGGLPFTGDTFLQLTRRIVHEQANLPDVTPRGEKVPDGFKLVIRGMLEKDVAKRLTLKQIRECEWIKDTTDPPASSVLVTDLAELFAAEADDESSPVVPCTVAETPISRGMEAKRRRLLTTAFISQVPSVSSVESTQFAKQMSIEMSRRSFHQI